MRGYGGGRDGEPLVDFRNVGLGQVACREAQLDDADDVVVAADRIISLRLDQRAP